MSRLEAEIRKGSPAPLTIAELVVLLGHEVIGDEDRQRAIACCLSGSDGWRDAVKKLGGAFAPGGQELKERKPG